MYSSPKYTLQFYAQNLRPYGFQAKRILGSGAFSEVILAIQDSNEYAIKCIRRKILKQKPQLLVYIKNQFEILEVLQHPNIIKQYGFIEDSQFYFIILEYSNIGNLTNFQAQLPERKFSLKDTREIIGQLIKGLKLVHDRGFIHRDIKPENILLKRGQGGKISFKIGDFGFARPIQNIVKTYCGTTNFMAPQILTDKPYTVSVDCWSLGVVMFFMLFGQLPFKGMDILTDIKRKCRNGFILQKEIQMEFIQQNYRDILSNFFQKLFVLDVDKRMKLSDMVVHPLFANIFQLQQQSMFKSQKKQVNLQLEKMEFLKDTISLYCQSNQGSLQSWQRLILHYYLLKTYLFYAKNLLNSLTNFNVSEDNENISLENWIAFCKSQTCANIAKQISEKIIIEMDEFNQLYEQIKEKYNEINIKYFKDSLTCQIQQKYFQEFKTSYRAVIGYMFKKVHDKNQISIIEQWQVKLRLFCCHLINRVFENKRIRENLKYYFNWCKQNQKSDRFDNNNFKLWLKEESKQNLEKTINQLYQRYMSNK